MYCLFFKLYSIVSFLGSSDTDASYILNVRSGLLVQRLETADLILIYRIGSGECSGARCEDNLLGDVGERIEPSYSQRPGFPSLLLPRKRFEEINTLALAPIQAED